MENSTNSEAGITLYQFEYQIIPMLIADRFELAPDHKFALYCLSYLDRTFDYILPTEIGRRCDFDTTDVHVRRGVVNDFICIVYTFPYPDRSPLAKFGAMIFNDDEVHYYTLERSTRINSEEIAWILGSTTSVEHSNFGFVKDCSSPDEFLSLLNKMGLLGEPKPVKGIPVKGIIGRLKKFFIRIAIKLISDQDEVDE